MKTVSILGSTGSIGTQALDVISRYPDRLSVAGLSAHTSVDVLADQIRRHSPAIVAVKSEREAEMLRDCLSDTASTPEIRTGPGGLLDTALYPGTDSVLNGLVGAAGLKPTLAALRDNREVLLANKESLVMAGELIRDILKSGNGSLIPVDSEHSAIYQCLDGSSTHQGLERIILTASGGPFRDLPVEEFGNITIEQALSHPTWKMGPKITIDSATLFNKGLEIIEAHYLFNLPPDKIDVVIHPASIVHSFVEFSDGSLLAQLSHPTMEIPIQYALLNGERQPSTVKSLNPAETGVLEFYPPDSDRFPALDLARHALEIGGTAPAVLNGANEAAVNLFLNGGIGFRGITRLVRRAIDEHQVQNASENAITNSDEWARDFVAKHASEVITQE